MSISGVATTAVYLSPQAIAPLSASTQPIALALAARPDLAEPAGTTTSKTVSKAQAAHQPVALSAEPGTTSRVDVYA